MSAGESRILDRRLNVDGGVSFNPADLGVAPLSLESLLPGQAAPADLFLAIYNKKTGKIELEKASAKGEEFKARWRDNLIKAGSDRVYVPISESDSIHKYFSRYTREIINDHRTTRRKKAKFLQEMASFNLRLLFSSDLGAASMTKAVGNMKDEVDMFCRDPQILTRLSDVLRDDYTTYSHAVNTSMLAMGFGRFLQLTDPQIKALGMGGLLADVGMTKVPEYIREKESSLSKAEMEVVRRHPKEGYDLLKNISAVPYDVLMIVLHHHENADGSGYPGRKGLRQTPKLARLVKIIDAYDAMTSARPHRPAMKPMEAGEQLRKGIPAQFSAGSVHKFLNFMASPYFTD